MNPARTRILAVRLPPSLAGGALSQLNCLLIGLAIVRDRCRHEPWSLRLELDETAIRVRDRALLLLSSTGDPVRLQGPENGVFDDSALHRFRTAALDILPATTAAPAVLERLLPEPEERPLEAAVRLWTSLLGPLGLEVVPAGQAASVDEWLRAPGHSQAESDGGCPVGEITWFGPRHLRFLRERAVEPRAALAGEAALRTALTPRGSSGILKATEALRQDLQAHLGQLERRLESEDPTLIGAWSRLRRDLRRATNEFQRRADRQARNRKGIRGARVHQLAQGLRPLDRAQQQGLGLVCAAALFELDLDALQQHVEVLAGDPHSPCYLLQTSPPGRIPSEAR